MLGIGPHFSVVLSLVSSVRGEVIAQDNVSECTCFCLRRAVGQSDSRVRVGSKQQSHDRSPRLSGNNSYE